MKLPVFQIPISTKVIATLIVTGVAALLRTAGVYETSPELTAWITTGAGLVAGLAVSEGTKYLQYALDQLGIPAKVDVEP